MCNAAWAQDAGSYIYFNDFETIDGTGKIATASKGAEGFLDATIQGSGSFANEGGVYGKVFQNVGGTLRTNYLKLPTDVFSHMAVSKQLTIGVWVKQTAAVDFYWAPILAAYGAAPSGSNGTPMLWCCANKLLQFNMDNVSWCDFAAAQCVGGTIDETSEWLDDKNWHYYTVTFSDKTVKVYIDGLLKNTWVLDDTSEGQKIGTFYTNGSNLSYVCLGGNQRWAGTGSYDNDPAFSFDDVLITNIALTETDIARVMNNKKDKTTYISEHKGDLTSLINGDFEEHAFGWTGGTSWWSPADWRTRSWRGTELNGFYELGSTGTMTYTLPNMPAGTYKVVAAARGYNGGTITAQIAGTSGTALTCVGDQRGADDAIPEINTNGVEMPYSSLGGFTTDNLGHNWRWITATGTLNEIGNLVINFNGDGTSWMAIDDVHLYYMNDGYEGHAKINDYCASLGILNSNPSPIDNGTKTITCDLVLSNPNIIISTTGGSAITTASGAMNNNIYNSGGRKMPKMVLYDGYNYADYSTSDSEKFVIENGATLYRNIPAEQWCTLMVPFYPTNLDQMKVPSASDATTVTFVDAGTKDLNNVPIIVKSTDGVTAITGARNGTYGIDFGNGTSGSGATMHGTYTNIATVTTGQYILARNAGVDGLYYVNSNVSLKPFRAYFDIPASARFLDIDFGDEATGISATLIDDEQTKADNIIFDLQGRRVGNPKKGIYIVNGKKVVIK